MTRTEIFLAAVVLFLAGTVIMVGAESQTVRRDYFALAATRALDRQAHEDEIAGLLAEIEQLSDKSSEGWDKYYQLLGEVEPLRTFDGLTRTAYEDCRALVDDFSAYVHLVISNESKPDSRFGGPYAFDSERLASTVEKATRAYLACQGLLE